MPHTIALSDKAWAFVESRRGQTPADDYVCMLIENIADISKEYLTTLDDSQIIDLIETYAPERVPGTGDDGNADLSRHREIARDMIDYLRDAYNDRVPRAVFQKKCRERGLSSLEIREAEEQFVQWLC
jgi:hypothetical protein